MTQSERLLELEERLKKLEENISYQQRDIEMLADALVSTQNHVACIYEYLSELKPTEIHHHYYKVTYNYPPEERKD